MAAFQYTATLRNREEHEETGTVVAKNELEAKKKLKQLNFDRIRLKKVHGLSGIFRSLSADVR